MFVQLVPEAIGLTITPLAIVGTILLLESARPVANSLAFGAAFPSIYILISVAVLIGGAAAGESGPNGDERFAGVVGIAIGALFLLGGLFTLVRHPVRRQRERRAAAGDEPGWVQRLEHARPMGAFLIGLGAAVVNPNVVILLSGLAIIVAADVSGTLRTVGVAFLVFASLLDFLIPIGLYLILGERAKRILEWIKSWTLAHMRVISIAMLLILGMVFTVRGIGKL